MKRLLAAVLLAAASAASAAQTIKLGTLAPQGSSWDVLLGQLGERWADLSGGKVKLRVFAGGTQGSEGDMIRKMAVGQLQAASITNIGMHDILPEPSAFSTPGLLDGDAEFWAVFEQVQSQLDGLFEKKGYVVLQWAFVGTVHIFCTQPYRSPAEMGGAKFFAWDGDPASVEVFRRIGFRPVVLASTDVYPSLQTGMISCVTQVPAYMLTARLFEKASHMIDYPWAYLIGATVVRKQAWDRLPAELRPKLAAAARELGAESNAEAKRINDDAIAAMVRQGLDVVHVEPEPWRAAAKRAWPAVRGEVVPAPFFDRIVQLRDAYRAAPKH